MTEHIQYLETQIEEITAWLATDEPQSAIVPGDKQYIVGIDNLYLGLDTALHISPLKALRLDLQGAHRLSRHTAARATSVGESNAYYVCVLRDAATKALYVIKETLALLECVKSDIDDNLRKV